MRRRRLDGTGHGRTGDAHGVLVLGGETSLTAFKSANAAELESLDKWGSLLVGGAKDTLIETDRADCDNRSLAMIKASARAEALEAS